MILLTPSRKMLDNFQLFIARYHFPPPERWELLERLEKLRKSPVGIVYHWPGGEVDNTNCSPFLYFFLFRYLTEERKTSRNRDNKD